MKGSATEEFTIAKANINDLDVSVADYGVYKLQASGATYAEPEITITTKDGKKLVRGVDYNVTVQQNGQKVGTDAGVTITGIGNYMGTKSDTFTVVNDIANATVELQLPATPYVYDGNAKTPVPPVLSLPAYIVLH